MESARAVHLGAVPLYLCKHDPNCQAIVDCREACGDDEQCGRSCMSNGESVAAGNLREMLDCEKRGILQLVE